MTPAALASIVQEPAALALAATAAAIGALHTLAGPDHWLPFVALARAGRWSLRRTLAVTVLCGAGHLAGSLVLALACIAIGRGFAAAAERVDAFSALRSDLAGWSLIAFGALYAAWGLRRAARSRPHLHPHAHADGTVHAHEHSHDAGHVHPHAARRRLAPWILFSIFVLGPCEPLIPLLIAPQVAGDGAGTWLVVASFAGATLAAMCMAVAAGLAALSRLRLARADRFSHALAGGAVLSCGVAMLAGL